MKKIIIVVIAIMLVLSNVSFGQSLSKEELMDLTKQIQNGENLKPAKTQEELDKEIIDYIIKYSEWQNQSLGWPLSINIDNKEIEFPDTKPFVDSNSRTLVPLRFVAEEFGVEVNWDNKEQRVDLVHAGKGKVIQFYIGKSEFISNGVKKQMDTEAIMKDGRTMIPVRFFAEEFGLKVEFSSKFNKVTLKTILTPISDNEKFIKLEQGRTVYEICEVNKGKEAFVYIIKYLNTSSPSASILGYCGNNKNIIIPEQIEGYPVVELSSHSLKSKGIETIVLPTTLTSIGEYALAFNDIKQIELPNDVYSVDSLAFYGNEIETLLIPNSVKFIHNDILLNNPIKTIYIDNAEQSIAFQKNISAMADKIFIIKQNGSKIEETITPIFLR